MRQEPVLGVQAIHRFQGPGPRRAAAAAILLGVLASCAVGPDYVAPKTATPTDFCGTQPTAAATRPGVFSSRSAPAADWWTTLGDPQLNALVQRALAGNLDLQRAVSRVRQSRAVLRLQGAKELPTVDASGQFVRINSGRNMDTGLGPSGSGINTNIWTAGLDASWELDVFGGQRRQIEAASADYQGSVEDSRDAAVSLAAEVARDYLQLRGLQRRLAIARGNLGLQQKTLALTQSLLRGGFNSQLDVSRAQTQVAQTRASLAPLTTQVTQTRHALAVLLGAPPDALDGELAGVAPVPAAPPTVAVGLPADLLRRRPDLRKAERQIAAANARVGAAVAEYFPKFTLTGDFGFDASKFEHLFNGASRYLVLDPSISWRPLDFGRTAASVEQEKARREQATLAYQQLVLTALREVEDALAAYSDEQDHHAELAAAVTSAGQAVAISGDQYRQGLIDFLQVLDAQRQALLVQDLLAQSDQAIATDLVALYKALGGGWDTNQGDPCSRPSVANLK